MNGNLYQAYLESCKFILDILLPGAKVAAIIILFDVGINVSWMVRRIRRKLEEEDNSKRRVL